MTDTVPPTYVLLVDDLDENLVALEGVLRRDGVSLQRARSGPEALELLLLFDFALALIDVHMPDMDGFELAELMRGTARTRQVPIVFVTANPDEPHRIFRGYDAGAIDFLIKPLEPRILRSKVGTFLELHDQKRRLRAQLTELEQVRDELALTLRLNETFVAAVGHDLRTPLSAIQTGAALLEKRTAAPDDLRIVRHVSSAARRMAGIIDQLGDVARVRLAGGLTLDLGNHDLAAIVGDAVTDALGAWPRAQIDRTTAGETWGRWDGARLMRIASNLIGNALQHGRPATPIQVHVDGCDPDRVVLSVSNQGAIPAGELPRMFEPFRRSSSDRVGLGLGLYIVREIAAAHGGTIDVRSTVADGTRFTVELPRNGPPASRDPRDPLTTATS